MLRALDVISLIEVPESLHSFAAGTMRVLVGVLGAGKSETAEAWHRAAIAAFAAGIGPVPVWLRATQVGNELMVDVARACGGSELLASYGCDLVIDELDALSDIRRAGDLLDEAAMLCARTGNIRILVTSRPDYRVPVAEQVEAPGLSIEQSLDIASSIGQIDRDSLSYRLHPSVLEAMHWPLYAILVGAEAQDALGIANRPALLGKLAERALEIFPQRTGANLARGTIRAALRRAAAASTSGNPLRVSDVDMGAELLLSRAVVEGAGAEIRFALAIIEQLFAAEALLCGEARIDEIVGDIKKVIVWRHAMAVALAMNTAKATAHLLDPIARNHPGLASWLLDEAVTVAGRPMVSPTPANEAELEKPASAVELQRAGHLVQDAMGAWMEGFAEVREMLGFASAHGGLRPLGVALGTKGRFEGCWGPDGRGLDDVFALYSSDGPTQPDYGGLFDVGPGWGPLRDTPGVAAVEGWQWAWTRDILVAQFDRVLRLNALPPRDGSMLFRERTWRLALEIQRARGVATPPSMDPTTIGNAIAEIEARALAAEWNDYDVRFMSGRRFRRAELAALAVHCGQLALRGEMLRSPLPTSDVQLGQGIWRDYTKDRLVELVSTVYREALIGYSQLVADYFPRAGQLFSLTALGPAHIEGTVLLDRDRTYMEPPGFEYSIRSSDPSADLDDQPELRPGCEVPVPTVDIAVAWEDEADSIAQRWERSRRQSYADLIPRGLIAAGFARPEGWHATLECWGDAPVTALAYRWLSENLVRFGWLKTSIIGR